MAACAVTLAALFAFDQADLSEPVLLRVCSGVATASTVAARLATRAARGALLGLDRASDRLADELVRRFPRGPGEPPMPCAVGATTTADARPARATSRALPQPHKRSNKHASRKRPGKRSSPSRAAAARASRARAS